MIYLKRPRWHLKENTVTDEACYHNRRQILKTFGGGALAAMMAGNIAHADESINPWTHLYPVKQNQKYTVKRDLTEEHYATSYNNFYEFGSHKAISKAAQKMKINPWQIEIAGEVEKPRTVDFDSLLKQVKLEQRIYRFRCVEAWAMTVPWSGFAMRDFVKIARPLSQAKYVSFETLADPETMPGLKQPWYPWPYLEGITMAEAMNELCFIATGIYDKPLPKQNGAPLRLVLPWKYGFKSIKSIVKINFSSKRPVSYWEQINAKEYGFWANVNPKVPHPRWSQATERLLGERGRVPTQIYNGYGEFVAPLYKNLQNERLFA